MRAVVYHGPGHKAWEEVPDPEIIGDGDAIVRIDAATICGTDLHILKGDVPAVRQGRILGHEAVGTIIEVGDGAQTRTEGDRVLVSCISACGTCRFCREGRYGQCLGTGVGVPATFELAVKLVRPGGRIANIGVHGAPVTLDLEDQWIRDITITTGLVDTYSTPTLLQLVASGQINVKPFITHHFGLDEFDEAYDVFSRAADTGALKVVLSRRDDE